MASTLARGARPGGRQPAARRGARRGRRCDPAGGEAGRGRARPRRGRPAAGGEPGAHGAAAADAGARRARAGRRAADDEFAVRTCPGPRSSWSHGRAAHPQLRAARAAASPRTPACAWRARRTCRRSTCPPGSPASRGRRATPTFSSSRRGRGAAGSGELRALEPHLGRAEPAAAEHAGRTAAAFALTPDRSDAIRDDNRGSRSTTRAIRTRRR
jgi:hypothetical protein